MSDQQTVSGAVAETTAEWNRPECGARHDDVTSITCHRGKGHTGEHQGMSIVTWSDDE